MSVIHGAHRRVSLYGSIQNHDPVGAGGGRWVSKGRRRPRLPSGHVSRPTSRRRPSADDRTHAPRIVPGRPPDAASTPLFSRQPKSHDFRIESVGGSKRRVSARATTTAADWPQTMRYFSWAFFASNSLFAPSRSPTGPRAWVGCGRPSGASLDANLAARPRVRDAPLGARRGLPSTANQAGRVKTSPLIRFFSSGLWRIGR